MTESASAKAVKFVASTLSALDVGGLTSLSLAPELAAFATGRKPALRFTVPFRLRDRFIVAAEQVGLATAARKAWSVRKSPTYSELVPRRPVQSRARADVETCWVVTCARVAADARGALDAELADADLAGHLLGYPPCCVAAQSRDRAGALGWVRLLVAQITGESTLCWANRLASEWGGGVPSGELYPCRLDCPNAIELGREAIRSMRDVGLERLADVIVAHACTALWFDENTGQVARKRPTDCLVGRWLRFEA